MKTYDAIVCLGNGHTENWQLPDSVRTRLEDTADLYRQGTAPKIVVCGKWSVNWDIIGTTPPTTESEQMRQGLVQLGVSNKDIIKEDDSKDTIGNVFYFKTRIAKRNKFKKILVIVTDCYLKRVKFLFERIVGNEFMVDYRVIHSASFNDPVFMEAQEDVLKSNASFLENMAVGDDAYLESRLYSDPYYKPKRPGMGALAAMRGAQ